MQKRVAIIGRPNVGKSTFLNKLVGSEKVVTSPIAGTTRDYVEHDFEWQGETLTAVDTGGITQDIDGAIEASVQEKISSVISSSDLVLFLVDVRAGLTEEDILIGKLLQKDDVPVILVVNKVDSSKHESDLYVFSPLGFDATHPISAASGVGVGDLLDIVVDELSDGASSNGDDEKSVIRFGLFGKQNAGKSSLLNALLNTNRAIVSDVPGTTIDPIIGSFTYQDTDFEIVDTAGLKRRAKVSGIIETASTKQSLRQLKDVSVACLVIDGSIPLTRQDTRIAQTIANYFLPAIIVITKLDLIVDVSKQSEVDAFIAEHKAWIRSYVSQLYYAPVIFVSSNEMHNIDAIPQKLLSMQKHLSREITQKKLDEFLQSYMAEYPPRGRRTRANPRISQLKLLNRNPFVFQLKTSKKGYLAASYVEHMKKSLHKHFGLQGWPLIIKR